MHFPASGHNSRKLPGLAVAALTHVERISRPIQAEEQLRGTCATTIPNGACCAGAQVKRRLAGKRAGGLILRVDKGEVRVPRGRADGVDDSACRFCFCKKILSNSCRT